MFVKIENKNPHLRSQEFYWYAKDDNTKMHYLFTESAMETAATRAINNPEDIPEVKYESFGIDQNKFWFGYFSGFSTAIIGVFLTYWLINQLM